MARFCADCGTRLSTQDAAVASGAMQGTKSRRELRPLTILFADLVSSSALATRLDPEDYTEIIGAFFRAVADAVARHGGYLGRFVGDGVPVFFGYATTQEDDAERAVRAALAILSAVASLNQGRNQGYAVRIGLSSGVVLVGDVADTGDPHNVDVYGEPPSMAARLQALAKPNTAVVSASVRNLVGTMFEFADLGAHTIKGWPVPARIYRVIRQRSNVSRFEARGAAKLPMFGRAGPLAELHAMWSAARTGTGRAVLITGEAGIGKSRLVSQLLRETSEDMHLCCFAAPNQQAMTLRPVTQWIEREARFADDDLPEVRLAKLRAVLKAIPAEDVALIADLLMIRDASLATLPPMTPNRRRDRLLQAIAVSFEMAARSRPILAVCEDAHWADPATQALLEMLVTRIGPLPILLVVTARPDYRPDWLAVRDARQIILDQLDEEESVALVRAAAYDMPMPRDTVDDIVRRSDGVPLFIEELTRAVTEAMAERGGPVDEWRSRDGVPVSLYASLLTRLDRLGPARSVAEAAAVIGREFRTSLLAPLLGYEEAVITPLIQRLQDSGIVVADGPAAGGTYRFRHALLQEAAQRMILREQSRMLHARVADLLETQAAEAGTTALPHIVAHHRTEAHQTEQAVAAWLHGAQQALLRSAAEEALVQLRRGIELVAELPETAERYQTELRMQLLIGNALLATKGHAAPETGEAFARARRICDRLPGTPLLMNAMHGQWFNALMRGALREAYQRAEEVLGMGERNAANEWLVTGYRVVGITCYFLGEFEKSAVMLRRAMGAFDPAKRHIYSGITVHDPEISMRCYESWASMWLGTLAEARSKAAESLRDAQAVGHFYTVAHALFTVAYVDINTGAEVQGLVEMEEALRFSARHGVTYFEMVSKIMCGDLIGRRGDLDGGLAMVRSGIAWHEATESRSYLPGFLATEGELMARTGDVAGGLTRLGQAFALMDRNDARWDEAELHRKQGVVLGLAGRLPEAEAAMHRAAAIAAASGARLQELHCSLSLAGLLAEAGRREAARDVLAPVLARFDGEVAPILTRAQDLIGALA
jgi:class 3 adenylate cyclase